MIPPTSHPEINHTAYLFIRVYPGLVLSYLDSPENSDYIKEDSKPRWLRLQGRKLVRVHLGLHRWNQEQAERWKRLVSAGRLIAV